MRRQAVARRAGVTIGVLATATTMAAAGRLGVIANMPAAAEPRRQPPGSAERLY